MLLIKTGPNKEPLGAVNFGSSYVSSAIVGEQFYDVALTAGGEFLYAGAQQEGGFETSGSNDGPPPLTRLSAFIPNPLQIPQPTRRPRRKQSPRTRERTEISPST